MNLYVIDSNFILQPASLGNATKSTKTVRVLQFIKFYGDQVIFFGLLAGLNHLVHLGQKPGKQEHDPWSEKT